MKKTIAAIIIIPLVLLGAAFGLSSVAKANAQKSHVELMETLLEGGKDFIKVPYDGEDATILSVHKSDKGYVIETAAQGYVDGIVMLVGVSNEGKVTGLVVCEAHETFGLGGRILTDHVFLSQFLNKDGSFTVAGESAHENAVVSVGDGENSAVAIVVGDVNDSKQVFSVFGSNVTVQSSGIALEVETDISVDGLSGATVSSKAVVKCVNSAVAYVTGADVDSSATTWGG